MASIDSFKAQLLGGDPRNSIDLRFSYLGQVERLSSFVKAIQIPASTIPAFEVNFRGSKLKIAGDRTFEDWTVSIINDVEFSARTILEAWQRDIQELDSGEGLTSLDYLLDQHKLNN